MNIQVLLEDEFVTDTQAVELQKLGIQFAPLAAYTNDDGHLDICFNYIAKNNIKEEEYTNAPLKQQAFRWFRRKHFLNSIIFNDDGDIQDCNLRFNYEIRPIIYSHDDAMYSDVDLDFDDEIDTGCIIGDYNYRTFDEAQDACLEALIEIVKKKQQDNG
jgi:hypothetical protein